MIATGVFLTVTVMALPILAYRSRHLGAEGDSLPPPIAIYLQLLMVQGTLGLLALLVIRTRDLPIGPGALSPKALLLGLALIAGFLLIQRPWRRQEKPSAVSQALSPRRLVEVPLYALALVAAAWGEELAYRGALFAILGSWTGSIAAGAVLSAIAFGLAHAAQRWPGVLLSAAIGLGLQGVVLVGGGLAPAVVTHLVYDLTAELIGRRRRLDR